MKTSPIVPRRTGSCVLETCVLATLCGPARALVVALAVLLGTLFGVATVRADALVVVEVHVPSGAKPVDGKVTLYPQKTDSKAGKTFQCETVRGKCTIEAVPGGLYTVSIVLAGGKAPPPRTVMIPPSGRVELHIPPVG